MSQTDAKSFVERIAEDEALRRDVIGALDGSAEKAAQEMKSRSDIANNSIDNTK